MSEHICFEIAINDNNGQDTGKLRAARLHRQGEYEDGLFLDCFAREIACYETDDGRIRVGRRTFPVVGYQLWVGSMTWDMALVTVDTANAIADVLRASGKYEPTDGAVELWDRWESGAPLFEQEAQVTP